MVARYVTAKAGLTDIPGMALNRHCAGGLSAVQVAAGSIAAGMDDAIIAGGTNSQSTSPSSRWQEPGAPEATDGWISPSHPGTPDAPSLDMSITVGWNTAVEAGLTREQLDAWGYRSHMRAVAAIDEGRFVQEIVQMTITKGGEMLTWEVDEHPRRSSTLEKMASLGKLAADVGNDMVFGFRVGELDRLGDLPEEIDDRRTIQPECLRIHPPLVFKIPIEID